MAVYRLLASATRGFEQPDESWCDSGHRCFLRIIPTTPTVTITPSNGSTNVGLNTQIVLAFSKSMNPATITSSTVALFNGVHTLGYSLSVSQDNRTVVLNPGGLPAGATINVALNSGVQDLSGNALQGTNSQFSLTQDLSTSAPYVTVMRPTN